MATVEELIHSDRLIRSSATAVGEALASVPTYTAPALARAVQAEQNLYAQIETEFGLLSATEAGRQMGSRSSAPRNLAASARMAGRLVAIRRGHQMLYPGFQFAPTGQPLPAIETLRRLAIEHGRSETGVVQWLVAPTTYLDGQRPVDLLVEHPDRVIDLASRAWDVAW
ncbi:hypothetical protein [Nocardioides sp.]|uniref:hypothetical protein n=1 Tax=Nocardioides sp. TaxID=35761 RepID=UPI00260400A6|nr:hypothetical protein [Nocardioides sp.]